MIFIEEHSYGFYQVKFKPVKENLDRIRKVPGGRYDGQKAWILPIGSIDEFESLFAGEFIYLTPRHELLNEPAPPLPKMYSKIPKEPITRMKFPLYNYQAFGANFLACIAARTGHAFLTDRVGTGKTPQAIAGAHILQDQGLVDKVIIFCKSSLKRQWLRDGIHKFTHDDGLVIDGTKAQRQKQYAAALDPKYRYVILNYELLLNDLQLIQDLIKNKGINLIINDEAHKLTNHKGKRNNALKTIVQPDASQLYPGVPYIFYLTATPLSSKIEQIFAMFNIRRPDHFGKFTEFSKEYLKWSYNGRSQELVGYKNLDKIRPRVFPYMLRRTEDEIDMELPELVEINRYVNMTPLQLQLDRMALDAQEAAVNRVNALYKAQAPKEQITQAQGSVQASMYIRKAVSDHPELLTHSASKVIQDKYGNVVRSGMIKGKVESPKMNELLDLVDELVVEGGEKLIIFSEFETMVRIIDREVKKLGVNSVTYTGKMNAQEKDDQITEFRDNPDCKVFICTDAAAEGLNLQFCPYLINYDIPWNPDILEQRRGRIQRGGSLHKKVKCINLMSDDSIDISIWNTLQNKLNLFNYLVENTKQQSKAIKQAGDQ